MHGCVERGTYVHTNIFIRVCVCAFECVCVYVCKYMYASPCTCMHTCAYIRTVCMCVFRHSVCGNVYNSHKHVHVCMYVRTYMCVCTYCTYVRMFALFCVVCAPANQRPLVLFE